MRLSTYAEMVKAADIVAAVMPPTPQYRWPLLDELVGAKVWLKHENHSPLGAFKLRGGLNYMAALRRRELNISGVVAATRGNHGQSVALAAQRHGMSATIVVPRGNSVEKNAAMRSLGAELIEHGDDFQSALEQAGRVACERGLALVPSFHPDLVCGVATAYLELFSAVEAIDVLYVPIGLGSGICGALSAKAALGLQTRVVGVVASAAPAYAKSFRTGRITHAAVADTLADGVACRTPDPRAFKLINEGVERVVVIDEVAIAEAMRLCFRFTHNVIEGAGALALAALLKERDRLAGRRIAAVLTGGNVDSAVFARILAGA